MRSLNELLATRRRRYFVGRLAETELFRAALGASEAPFAVLHIHGPGGLGKTTLLDVFATLSRRGWRARRPTGRPHARPVARIGARRTSRSRSTCLTAMPRCHRSERLVGTGRLVRSSRAGGRLAAHAPLATFSGQRVDGHRRAHAAGGGVARGRWLARSAPRGDAP